MYDDYPTIYKTDLNHNFVYIIIGGVIIALIVLITLIGISRVFKKANRSPVRAYIPIIHLFPLFEITNISKKHFLVFLLPLLDIPLAIFHMPFILLVLVPMLIIPVWIKINLSLAKLFKKSSTFGLGLSFLPFIFYPILGFGDSEYIGINLVAMEGKTTVEDIPVIDMTKNNPIEVEENDQVDTASKGINISIGGGRYQKDYTNTLLNVNEEKVLKNIPEEEPVDEKATKFSDKRIIDTSFVENNNIPTEKVPVEEPKQENTILQNLNQVAFTNTAPVNNVEPVKTAEKVTSSAEPEYKLCPNCGTRLQDGATMCFICGQPIK